MSEKTELENDKYYSHAKKLIKTEKSLPFNTIKEIIDFMRKWDEIRSLYNIE